MSRRVITGAIIYRGRHNGERTDGQRHKTVATCPIFVVEIHRNSAARGKFTAWCKYWQVTPKALESIEPTAIYHRGNGKVLITDENETCHTWQIFLGANDESAEERARFAQALDQIESAWWTYSIGCALNTKIPRGMGQGAGPRCERAEKAQRISRSLFNATKGSADDIVMSPITDLPTMRQHVKKIGASDGRSIRAIDKPDGESHTDAMKKRQRAASPNNWK